MEVPIDSEGAVKEWCLAVTVHHNSCPPSHVPAVLAIATYKGLTTKDLVLSALDGCCVFGPAVTADSCDGEVLVNDVCVGFENKAYFLDALVDGKDEVEVRMCVDSV